MAKIDNTNLGHLVENMYESFLNKENVIEGQVVDLATVAFTGSYNDLIDKPTISEDVITITDDLIIDGGNAPVPTP